MSPLKLLRILAWKVAGSFLLVVLASCGGGSSNDSGGATATQLQGLYRANPLTKEFMSFVIPTSSGNATWYGWHFFHEDGNGTGDEANLFTGTLSLGINGAAQSNIAGVLSYSTDNPTWKAGVGSIVISQGSLNSFQATINYIPNGGLVREVSLSSQAASFNSEYVYGNTASYSALTGTWDGAWNSKDGRTGASLKFVDGEEGKIFETTPTPGWSCNVNQRDNLGNWNGKGLKLTKIIGANYFTVTVTLPVSGCTWTPVDPKVLTGVGFIHSLGGNSVLEIMLIDDQGRGIISFRGVK